MKLKQIITLIFGILVTSHFASAEEQLIKKIKRVDYGIGFSHLRMLDKQVTPFIYTSNNVPFHFGYNIDKGKTLFEYNFNAILGINGNKTFQNRKINLRTPNNEGILEDEVFELSKAPILQQELSVKYLKKVNWLDKKRMNLFFGGEINEQLLISFTGIPIFTFVEVGLSPSLLLKYKISDNSSINTHISIPIIGMMYRLPYANDPVDGKHGPLMSIFTTGGNFASLHNYQRINYSIEYEKELSKKWSIGCEYSFYWLRFTKYRGVKAYNNSLIFNFIKTLK